MKVDDAWYAKRRGRALALLTERVFVDMFWFRWRVTPLGVTAEELDEVFTGSFWNEEHLVLRNRGTGAKASNVLVAGHSRTRPPTAARPYIEIRGL